MTLCTKTLRQEKGFTLVELAVVMIIIGLLIGGVLKGQELISNAQVAATVAQVKAYEAATTTFLDKYDALPGDMGNPAGRLPNCTGACVVAAGAGIGNGRLDNDLSTVFGVGAEAPGFFPQLAAAELVTGIRNDASGTWGDDYPESELEGGFWPGFHPGGPLGANAVSASPGHYLVMTLNAEALGAAGTFVVNANEAFRIDSKVDDGAPTSGTVFPATPGACDDGAVYLEADTSQNCDLVLRFQS